MKPAQQENISENAALMKTRVRTKIRARKGHKSRKITSRIPINRYPKRKMR